MAVVYEKGIVVIPKKIRQEAGLKTGSEVRYRVEDKRIIIEQQDNWGKEHEQLRKEMKKIATGKELEKRFKDAQRKWENRYDDVH